MESMPEYRRFIAYFYEYIDGKKMNNVGFAKVELRSGMWRILFRLTAVHSPEPPVQVYGFVREKEYLLGLLMGTMRCGNQMLEEWAYRADTPIWKQQYGFSDLAGIWIQCGDGHRYVTVWDDDPIEINRFVLELPDKRNVKRAEAGENSETGELVENSRKDGRQMQQKKDRNCLSMRTGMRGKKLPPRVERWIMWRLHSSQRTESIQHSADAVHRLHHAMRLYSAGRPLSRSGIRSLRHALRFCPAIS